MSARDVARHFQRHESTISRLLNRFQQTENVADRPRSGRPCKPRVPSLRWHSADMTELSSLLLYRICNNITMGFSNMIMSVHTLRGIPGTFYASITSLCCSGLQDHRTSPIEHLGHHLGRQVRERHDVKHIRDLKRTLQAEWLRIPLQAIRKLICSMRRRCLSVLAANGGHTRY